MVQFDYLLVRRDPVTTYGRRTKQLRTSNRENNKAVSGACLVVYKHDPAGKLLVADRLKCFRSPG